MKRLPFTQPDEIVTAARMAAEVVAAGGVVLLPTESYYGLGVDPLDADGVARICAMKNRGPELGLPVLCAGWEQLETLVRMPERFRIKLSRMWPAPLTVVVPSIVATAASRGGTLAVRIPAHASLRALLYRTGPLTGTSANRHGRPPCATPDAALASLLEAPNLVLDAGPAAGGEPSTVVDLSGEAPRVLRSGACPWDDPKQPY